MAQVREIFRKKGKNARVRLRSDTTESFGFGPRSLIPKDPKKEFATVFLWIEGDRLGKLIAFRHDAIPSLPLGEVKHKGKSFKTMQLSDFHQRYVFKSLEDLEKRFPW